ncbi:hypothetical protein H2201_008957 [Coniosporium apollinis]|uniref:NAD-dependent epimerase/dehydratase domain-containing protein n=1 Tax=Coniosporium apollinis TaxID=61459 RepID=A0ABQ9NLH3_9PEZI|nr:hypothetical protein H2201_008957 [Coniosporium apollinis]
MYGGQIYTAGFIGSYIVAAALSFGYQVRGTVRSDGKAAVSHKTHGNNLKYTTAVVPDVAAPSAFDGASKDVHGVVHVASNMSFNNDPAKESIDQGLNTPADKRDDDPRFGQIVYAAAKTEEERAAWTFVRDQKPGFGFNSVLPNYNAGRVLPGVPRGPSGQGITNVYQGNPDMGFPAQWMINVEDDAKIHIACLADKTVNGERVLQFTHPFNWNDVLAVIRQLRPQAKTIEDIKGQQRDWSTVDNEIGAELLRKLWGRDGHRTFEESVRNNLELME